MTPMVDVVMVMLIFFMAATTFAGPEWFLKTNIEPPVSARIDANDTRPKADPLKLPPVQWKILLERRAPAEGSNERITVAALIYGSSDGRGKPRQPLEGVLSQVWSISKGTATDSIVVKVVPTADVPWEDVVRAHEAVVAAGITKAEISLSWR